MAVCSTRGRRRWSSEAMDCIGLATPSLLTATRSFANMHLVDHVRTFILRLPAADDVQSYTWPSTLLHCQWFTLCILAAHIRLRYPSLNPHWRALYAFVAIPMAMHLALLRRSTNSQHPVHDIGSGFWCFVAVATICDYCFTSRSDDFNVLGADRYKAWLEKRAGDDALEKEHLRSLMELSKPILFPGTLFPLEFEAIANERGTGYQRGPDVRGKRYRAGYEAYLDALTLKDKPDEAWTLKKRAIVGVLPYIAVHHLLLDMIAALLASPIIVPSQDRLAPPCTLIDVAHGPAGFVGVCLVKLATATFIVSGMQYMENILLAVELVAVPAWKTPVVLARYDPRCANLPIVSTSLQELWNQRWHQRNRRQFLIGGYRPAKRMAACLGFSRPLAHAVGTLGAFFVSGIAHELCLESLLPHYVVWNAQLGIVNTSVRTADRGFGARRFATTRFFVAQGMAIIFENVWTDTIEPAMARRMGGQSGKLVEGTFRKVLGWAWTMTWMMYMAYDFVDLWLIHGFATVPAFGRQRPLTAFTLNAILTYFFKR